MNILIRAKKEKVEHKLEKNLLKEYAGKIPEDLYCYWSGVHPKNNSVVYSYHHPKVMFTDGCTVYAEGEIIGVDDEEGLQFMPLKEVNYPQPKSAPTRGFTYVS